jgi:hypothetical protein
MTFSSRSILTAAFLVAARLTACGDIQIADGRLWTTPDAFFTAFAILGMIDMRMLMFEKDGFSKDVVGTCLHAFPTGVAPAGVDFNEFRA